MATRTGRWSKLRTRFLEENRPEELKQMQEDGTLTEYMDKIDCEYNERFDQMEEKRLKEIQLEIRYSKHEIDWQTYVGEYNQLRNEIYEILTQELCQ